MLCQRKKMIVFYLNQEMQLYNHITQNIDHVTYNILQHIFDGNQLL